MALAASRWIAKGTVVYVKCDFCMTFDVEEVGRVREPYQSILLKYGWVVPGRRTLVLDCGVGRYANHSCDPSTLPVNPFVEIAIRDIAPRDEITHDYATFGRDISFDCRCGAATCRGKIHVEDCERLESVWAPSITAAMSRFNEVEQPLRSVLEHHTDWLDMLEGRAMIRPIGEVFSFETNLSNYA